MAAWSNSAVAPAPSRRAREQARPAARPRKQARPAARQRVQKEKRRLTGGILWITVLGLLFAGVVALNVAVLRLNMQVDRLDQQRTQLRDENAALQSELAGAAAAPRLQARASKLGLHQASAQDTTYVQLTGR